MEEAFVVGTVGGAKDDPACLNDSPIGGNELEREVASCNRFSTLVCIWTLLSELEDLPNRTIYVAQRFANNRLQQIMKVLKVEHSLLSAHRSIAKLWPSQQMPAAT